jgi:hypothetical protein
MKQDWFAARFGFGASEVIAHAGAANVDLREFKINVASDERDKLGSPQAGTPR